MRILKHIKLFEAYFAEAEVMPSTDPVALSILGAPAGGNSYNKQLLAKLEELTQIAKAANPNFSEDLTVDILRGKIQKLPEDKQIELFYWGFYTLRELAEEDQEYVKWYADITKLWSGKLKDLLELKGIDAEINADDELELNGKIGEDAVKLIQSRDLSGIIDDLDNYQDYKRVVRAYQITMQKLATEKKKDIVYDESGNEPEKIIKNMRKMDKADYVTDVIMVHHKDVINNLFQNAARMVIGSDGGRDSSGAIVQAYLDINNGMDKYKDAAEVAVDTSTAELQKGKGDAIAALSKANTEDDAERGDKPIDVFVRIYGDEPDVVLDKIAKQLDKEQYEVFKAIVTYQVQDPSINVPIKTKEETIKYVGMDNEDALDILTKASTNEKYKHAHGGVDDKLLKKAKKVLA